MTTCVLTNRAKTSSPVLRNVSSTAYTSTATPCKTTRFRRCSRVRTISAWHGERQRRGKEKTTQVLANRAEASNSSIPVHLSLTSTFPILSPRLQAYCLSSTHTTSLAQQELIKTPRGGLQEAGSSLTRARRGREGPGASVMRRGPLCLRGLMFTRTISPGLDTSCGTWLLILSAMSICRLGYATFLMGAPAVRW